jgi:tetratricopeptide (TPR) repeat protein
METMVMDGGHRSARGEGTRQAGRFACGIGATLVSLAVSLGGCVQAAPLPAKAIALNRDGAMALAAGDLPVAEARVALALEYNPRFTEAWVNLGLVELQHGNFEQARRDFVKARDLNPDLPVPHHALGLLADREGHVSEAEALYRAALKVDPGFAPARANLGRILFARGALDEAREQFLRLTQVAPDSVEGWAGLCESLIRLHRIEDAQDVLIDGVRRLGRRPPFDLLEARLLLEAKAFGEAEDRLEALTQGPDPRQAAAAFAWMAIARLGQGDAAAAQDAAERATSLDPDEGVARFALRVAREAVHPTPP